MSIFDDWMKKISVSDISTEDFSKLMDVVDAFTKEHPNDSALIAEAAKFRAAIVEKMTNNARADSHETALRQEENKEEPIKLKEYVAEMKNLRELEKNPTEYFKKCEEILKNPQDLTLAEQAIYGVGKMVENNPNVEVALEAINVLKLCSDNEKLINLDLEHKDMMLIENAMKHTVGKMEGQMKVIQDIASNMVNRYSINRQQAVSEKDKAVSMAPKSQSMENINGGVCLLNEDKLPMLRLAPNSSKDCVVFDLNSIAEDLKALKPGESLAIGRDPESAGVEGKLVKVGENNRYISRHHCDIRRNEQGKLELVDRSKNGTNVVKSRGILLRQGRDL